MGGNQPFLITWQPKKGWKYHDLSLSLVASGEVTKTCPESSHNCFNEFFLMYCSKMSSFCLSRTFATALCTLMITLIFLGTASQLQLNMFCPKYTSVKFSLNCCQCHHLLRYNHVYARLRQKSFEMTILTSRTQTIGLGGNGRNLSRTLYEKTRLESCRMVFLSFGIIRIIFSEKHLIFLFRKLAR